MEVFVSQFHRFCVPLQPAHLAQYSAYWQGIEIELRNLDLNLKPTDQIESWVNLEYSMPPPLPFGFMRVDVYQGPGGWGFTTTAKIVDVEDIWEKAFHTGPETWREHDWEIVDDGEE